MAYTIKKFYRATGQITVQFDNFNQEFAVDLPLDANGLYVTGADLETYINGFAPTDFINRGQQVAAGIANAADIAALAQEVIEPATPEQIATQIADSEAAKANEIEKYVKAALIKNGVISA